MPQLKIPHAATKTQCSQKNKYYGVGRNNSQMQCVRKAFQMLSERYRLVLHYLVIEKMSALDAFPLLDSYIHPRPKDGLTSDEVKKAWSSKQRQDALSLLKGYALKHLQENFESIKNNLKS